MKLVIATKKALAFLASLPIYFYRSAIRPLIPSSCVFYPTCSAYALISIKRHGVIVGWFMALKRILRCNPFNRASEGYDPVPFRYAGGAKWVI